MKEKYLQKVPTWYSDFTKYDVVLSDDLDGIVSTSALKFAKNWNVEYFYDFSYMLLDRHISRKTRTPREFGQT